MKLVLFTALLFAMLVGLFVEIYKKRVRGDKAKKAEITLVAVIPSVAAGVLLTMYAWPMIPLTALWAKVVVMAAVSLVFYLVQLFVDMRIIKDLMRQYFWDKTPELLDELLEKLPEDIRPAVKTGIEKVLNE